MSVIFKIFGSVRSTTGTFGGGGGGGGGGFRPSRPGLTPQQQYEAKMADVYSKVVIDDKGNKGYTGQGTQGRGGTGAGTSMGQGRNYVMSYGSKDYMGKKKLGPNTRGGF